MAKKRAIEPEETDNSWPTWRGSGIRNKQLRSDEFAKFKKDRGKAKSIARKKRKKEREALGKNAPPKLVPRTLENTREKDETMVEADDTEVKLEEDADEMASYFKKEVEPKILITTSHNPKTNTHRFCKELTRIIPNSVWKFRRGCSVKKMVELAADRGFTDIIVINEDRRNPNGLLLIHLPHGPTALFRLSSIKYSQDIKGRGQKTTHRPEVILNNFNTRLGHRVGRMLAAIFNFNPEFKGRSCVTFHNQRDYIFFRFHRYEFRNAEKVGLQELGPRFTLRLRTLQNGTFDSKFGEYEWCVKRHEMETSRRRFFL